MSDVTTAAAALVAAAALMPVPIGVGPRFHPAPAAHGDCRPGSSLAAGRRMHLELFAAGRVVLVPAGIGLRDARYRYGRAVDARCRTELWTTDPSGVVRFAGSQTLRDLFRVWGRRLGPRRLLSFRGAVRVYRNGERVTVDPRTIALRGGDELVLEVGPYVPPHRTYRFPR